MSWCPSQIANATIYVAPLNTDFVPVAPPLFSASYGVASLPLNSRDTIPLQETVGGLKYELRSFQSDL